jgi:23S rRNA (cytosine1962-C5)-methyltransferase
MRIANEWREYELLDATEGERLERWGETLLIRPDPQIIWQTPKTDQWRKAAARYVRSETGGGAWDEPAITEKSWSIAYKALRFKIKPTGFKHTGLFPEQAANWETLREIITAANRPVRVLNLFAYTGGATLACAAAGAEVAHVDASKGMVAWARENAALSALSEKPIRWIVDDCKKFAEREIRRGSLYDGIIMDPPSYGRGPNGELWKLEDAIHPLVELCERLLKPDAVFFMLNSYTTGLSAGVMGYVLGEAIQKKRGGGVKADELGLPVKSSGLNLPCGSTAIWRNE